LLAAQREALNERFAARRRAGAKIDPAVFQTHLRVTVGPLLEAVHTRFPERATAVLTALYDASLDLFTASLLGPETKLPAVRQVWSELLPSAIALLAREPVSLAGCLCNATFQVAQQRGTRPDLWLDRMGSTLPRCQSVGDAVDAGLVAAWQAGMPQFRGPALAAAERLKPLLAAAVLGLPPDVTAHVLRDTLTKLKADRWFRIGASAEPSAAVLPVAQAGAFTGFGGPFPRPPKVFASEGALLASAGDNRWRMIADAYGVWFHRVATTDAKPTPLPGDVSVNSQGTVRWGRLECPAPHLSEPTAVACDGDTLAVTIPTSHHVYLFARTGSKT
jgi:hypothetical protein